MGVSWPPLHVLGAVLPVIMLSAAAGSACLRTFGGIVRCWGCEEALSEARLAGSRPWLVVFGHLGMEEASVLVVVMAGVLKLPVPAAPEVVVPVAALAAAITDEPSPGPVANSNESIIYCFILHIRVSLPAYAELEWIFECIFLLLTIKYGDIVQ